MADPWANASGGITGPSDAHLARMVEAVGEHPHHDVTKKAHRDALGIDS